MIEWTGASVAEFHRPPRLLDRWLRTGQVAFARGLVAPNPGTIARVCQFLNDRARPNDIVLTNYEWEPLYFHTRLPQALKLSPTSPVYAAARRRLPDYVFHVDRVRWVVFRRAWGAYGGQDLDRVLAAFRARGYSVRLAATVPETVWENRENVHFRRFAGRGYLYPWYGALPETQIFEVSAS
jgi:hypothetical protein